MKKRYVSRSLIAVALTLLVSMLLVAPVMGADIRTKDVIIIDKDVDDDLYVACSELTVNAAIHGDLVAVAADITINGTVDGDFWGAGGKVHINGTVADDARFAGSDLRLGSASKVGDDVFAAGFGFDAESGSSIGGDLFVAGYQALLGGEVAGDVQAAVAGLEISGHMMGDVKAEVEEPDPEFEQWSFFMRMYNPYMPARIIGPGLKVADEAVIDGDLTYTSPATVEIPGEVVGGAIVYQTPVPEEVEAPEVQIPEVPAGAVTLAAFVGWIIRWVTGVVRTFVTLFIIGLLVLWLAQRWLHEVAEHWKEKPLHSLGWGVAAILAFLAVVPTLFMVMIVLDIIVGLVTLGGLVGPITGVVMVLEGALLVAFSILSVFVTKVAFSYLVGWLILKRTAPVWIEKAMGLIPLLIGLAIFVAVRSIPFLGGLFSLTVTVFGLGAIWLLAWVRIQKRRAEAKA
jgi:hypothetical protein